MVNSSLHVGFVGTKASAQTKKASIWDGRDLRPVYQEDAVRGMVLASERDIEGSLIGTYHPPANCRLDRRRSKRRRHPERPGLTWIDVVLEIAHRNSQRKLRHGADAEGKGNVKAVGWKFDAVVSDVIRSPR